MIIFYIKTFPSLKNANKIQELFGGDRIRKPNAFGYFLKTSIDEVDGKRAIFIKTNWANSKKEFIHYLKSNVYYKKVLSFIYA